MLSAKPTNDIAAHSLEGRTLKTGWFVKKKIEREPGQSGSTFSIGYIVEKDAEECFMKVFDFAAFLSTSNPELDTMQVMQEMINAYTYEKDLSIHCQKKHVTKVSFVIAHGDEMLPEFAISFVPYLIFKLADGDIRSALNVSKILDYAWRFKSLHDIAVGLKQLHAIDVCHQDLKPSNILVFDSESKLCDLGRSVSNDIKGPYKSMIFSGDRTYAPPEIWYKFHDPDWKKKSYAADCFMLGSLVTFYFAGIPMSALLSKHIPEQFNWVMWNGEFSEIIPYLENAFSLALKEFEANISDGDTKKELCQLVEYLCNPFPEKRGHPKNISSKGNSYSMDRFISQFDRLRLKAEISIKGV